MEILFYTQSENAFLREGIRYSFDIHEKLAFLASAIRARHKYFRRGLTGAANTKVNNIRTLSAHPVIWASFERINTPVHCLYGPPV